MPAGVEPAAPLLGVHLAAGQVESDDVVGRVDAPNERLVVLDLDHLDVLPAPQHLQVVGLGVGEGVADPAHRDHGDLHLPGPSS